jgi:hypothetical protein
MSMSPVGEKDKKLQPKAAGKVATGWRALLFFDSSASKSFCKSMTEMTVASGLG